jgi:hypothetical protein
MQAKAREFHECDALLAGRESPCPDNTIEGNVMLEETREPRLLERDNGEGGAGGQPAAGAFPESFAGVSKPQFVAWMERSAIRESSA